MIQATITQVEIGQIYFSWKLVSSTFLKICKNILKTKFREKLTYLNVESWACSQATINQSNSAQVFFHNKIVTKINFGHFLDQPVPKFG